MIYIFGIVYNLIIIRSNKSKMNRSMSNIKKIAPPQHCNTIKSTHLINAPKILCRSLKSEKIHS